MPTLTKNQTKTVRGMAAQALPDDDAYRSFLRSMFPTKEWDEPDRPSTLELSKREADAAIKALKRLLGRRSVQPWEGRYVGRGHTGQAKHLTQDQADEIARLEHKLGWLSDPRRISGFIKRQIGRTVKVPRLSKREASKVITGLRKVLRDTG